MSYRTSKYSFVFRVPLEYKMRTKPYTLTYNLGRRSLLMAFTPNDLNVLYIFFGLKNVHFGVNENHVPINLFNS